MAIQFPNNPTNGQVYSGYYYDSTLNAWKASPISAGPTSIADTAPSGAIHGDMWYNSTDGAMYIYVNDGTSSQWVEVHSNTAATPGTIVNMETYTNSTRATWSSGTATQSFWSITFNKKLSSSKLVITGHFAFKGGWEYAANWWASIDAIDYYGVGFTTDTSDAGTNQTYYMKSVDMDFQASGHSAGTKTITFKRSNYNASTYSAMTFNPGYSDDNRFPPNTVSTITVMEVAQ